MLITIEQLIAEVRVSRLEVTTWVERRWVLPVEDPSGQLFNEADRARIQLIAELRHDLKVSEETMPMVLGLLDQVYTLRRTVSELRDALDALPDEARQAVQDNLRKRPKV